MDWPRDADGDVFRRLEADAFDFTREHEIDFSVDFLRWPPHVDALTLLGSRYGKLDVVEPYADPADGMQLGGYVGFKIRARVTYELVTGTQADVTHALQGFGARCEAWG